MPGACCSASGGPAPTASRSSRPTRPQRGWLVARENDLRRELADLLARAEREDAFEDRHTTRQVADKVLVVLAELGEWSQAMDWVERAYHRRPGRLRRVLNDLPYDHHGLARDPRYARLLRSGRHRRAAELTGGPSTRRGGACSPGQAPPSAAYAMRTVGWPTSVWYTTQ